MSKVLSFRQQKPTAQESKNLEGEKMFKKAEYFVVGEVNGTEVRVPFEGTVYTECEKCGKVIDFDVHDLISCENDNEDFTEFGAFTCLDCLQKEKQEQGAGLGRIGLDILEMTAVVNEELNSMSYSNKDAINCILAEAFAQETRENAKICLEKVRGYVEALDDNRLIDTAEYDMLTMAIDAAQGREGC